jgi:hypothetical protein
LKLLPNRAAIEGIGSRHHFELGDTGRNAHRLFFHNQAAIV